jgi:hypothetical protein
MDKDLEITLHLVWFDQARRIKIEIEVSVRPK